MMKNNMSWKKLFADNAWGVTGLTNKKSSNKDLLSVVSYADLYPAFSYTIEAWHP